eukprot:GEMP01078522.1.p1 GENE.GEMP01078522.1~~GEMP01078522.1.p1  ORF type:complete len:103 (+),score=16.15 GEMP01078522.1:71-379(+)
MIMQLLFFVLCISGVVVSAKKKSPFHVHHREMTKRRECMRGPCMRIYMDENDDCVDRCVSETCYNKLYAHNPLEPGELDTIRRSEFNVCLDMEVRAAATATS